jgi:HEAT repeats
MRRSLAITLAGAAVALPLFAAPAGAQGLAQRITSGPSGEVRLSFAARPDVCGDGERTIRSRPRHRSRADDDDAVVYTDKDCSCTQGPVRVLFRISDHRVTRVRSWVGGEWRIGGGNVTDLGTVSSRDAVAALLAIAADSRHSGGEHAVFPATLADSVTVWPALLRLARDDRAPRDSRKQAVFWVSQAAGDSATAGLSQLAESEGEDGDIRTQAVFALSQRPKDEGIPALIRVARTSASAEVRRSALFWLGQSEDPRALALFEELLTGK